MGAAGEDRLEAEVGEDWAARETARLDVCGAAAANRRAAGAAAGLDGLRADKRHGGAHGLAEHVLLAAADGRAAGRAAGFHYLRPGEDGAAASEAEHVLLAAAADLRGEIRAAVDLEAAAEDRAARGAAGVDDQGAAGT